MLFLFLFGCSDYNLQTQKQPENGIEPAEDEASGLTPHLVVDPTSIAIDAYCEGEILYQDIMLLNSGEGPLEITDLSLTGTGWSILPVEVPFTIDAGNMYNITLQAGAGEGILTITSNDPVDPSLWIELFATVDSPPQVTIQDPNDGAIVPIGGMDLVANVQETEDSLDSLTIQWSSNIDGPLGSSIVDSTGQSTFPFSATTYGNHELSATVYDSCHNEGYDAVGICQHLATKKKDWIYPHGILKVAPTGTATSVLSN